MKKIIVGFILLFLMTSLFAQQIEKLDYCNCEDKIEQLAPVLNGAYERTCNGKLIEKGEFIEGKKNGVWTSYSGKGALIRKMNFLNGNLNGTVELFYLNGSHKFKGKFEDSKKEGAWVYFTKKGKVLLEGNYKSNIPIGIWTAYDKKGKKQVLQYDFDSGKQLTKKELPIHPDETILQNENTEGWYILRSPEIEFKSKTSPLGGYRFTDFIFANLVEVPIDIWDTFLYRKYKIDFHVSSKNETAMKMEMINEPYDKEELNFIFLIVTNPIEKIKKKDHTALQLNLLDMKIKETLNLMPPWIFNEDTDVEVVLHYVLNKNLY